MPILIARDIVGHSGGDGMLRGVSLGVEPGEVFGLLGADGTGKSELAAILAGIAEPESGTVTAFGEPLPSAGASRRIGFMPQADAVYDSLTGMENLAFFATLGGLTGNGLRTAVVAARDAVGLGAHANVLVRRDPHETRRRLSLALALLHQPDLLVLDEPTAGLDGAARSDVWGVLRTRADAGTAVVITTAEAAEAERCDRLAVIHDGAFVAMGAPHDLRARADASSLEAAVAHLIREAPSHSTVTVTGGGHRA